MGKFIEKLKNMLADPSLFTKIMLAAIALGVWGIFIQNFVRTFNPQEVYIVNTVRTDPVSTVSVSVENEVEVDLQKVLGYPIGCHRSYNIDGKEYQAVDVWNRAPNW